LWELDLDFEIKAAIGMIGVFGDLNTGIQGCRVDAAKEARRRCGVLGIEAKELGFPHEVSDLGFKERTLDPGIGDAKDPTNPAEMDQR
jgi:hypothetical protein